MAVGTTLTVGLTGGIGTGKSRVSQLLRELGAAVECSDEIVRELQAPGGAALDEIRESFGEQMLLPGGELDRVQLGELVFGDPTARKQLNDILHPRVYAELLARVRRHKDRGEPVVVLDIPLLLEGRVAGRGSGARMPFDWVVLVYADPGTQLARIMARDGLSREQALARIGAQLPIDRKREMVDGVIENGGDWESTARQVREQYRRWLSDRGPSGPPR